MLISVENVLHQVKDRRLIEIEVTGDAQRTADSLQKMFSPEKLEVKQVIGHLLRVSFEAKDADIAALLANLVTQGPRRPLVSRSAG